MHTILQQAQHAFDNRNYTLAKILYGQCITANSKEISQDEKKVAIYVVAYIYVVRGDFSQAYIYYKLLDDSNFTSKLLPKRMRSRTISEIINRVPLTVLKRPNITAVDFSGCQLKGKTFTEILGIIRTKSQITSLCFSHNPLNEAEVNQLLDVYLTRSNLANINLSGLPINKEALLKIEAIIEKVELQACNDIDQAKKALNIHLTNCQPVCDMTILTWALRGTKTKHICVYYTDANSNTTKFVSSASIHNAADDQKKKFISQIKGLGNSYLPSGIKQIKNTLKSDPNTTELHQIVYDAQGHIVAHIVNVKGHVTVIIVTATELTLDSLDILKTCQSLVIIGPGSSVILNNILTVIGTTQIYCDTFLIKLKAKVNTEKLLVYSEHKINFQGKIDAEIVALETQNFIFGTTAQLSSSSNQIDENQYATIKEKKLEAELIDQNVVRTKTCIISGKNLILRGKIIAFEIIELYADNEIALDSKSSLATTQLRLNSKQIKTLGDIICSTFLCQGDQIRLGGKITSLALSDNQKPQNTIFSVQSQALIIDGLITIDSMLFLAIDQLYFSSRGKLNDLRTNTTLSNFIQCKKHLYLEKGAMLSLSRSLVIATQDLTLYGTLQSDQNIQLEINGRGEIYESGNIRAGKNANLEGWQCWNAGDVHADEHLNLAFDHFFVNGICDIDPLSKFKIGKLLGSLSAKNISVTSGFFLGLLSHISAENSVQINAFLELNIGLINGKHISHSNIVGIDLGMNITAIESTKSIIRFMHDVASATASHERTVIAVVKDYYVATDSATFAATSISFALHIASIAGKLLAILAPQIGLPWNVAVNCANLLIQLAINGATIKKEIHKLIDRHQNVTSLRPRDVYVLILAVKNLAMTGAYLTTVSLGVPSILQHLPDQIKNNQQNLMGILPSIAGLFAGSVTEQSVFQINGVGATITGLANTTDAIHLSLFHQTIAGTSFINSLFICEQFCTNFAAMSTISALDYIEDHGNQIIGAESIQSRSAHLGGHAIIDNLTVVVDHLVQDGSTKTQTAVVNAHDAQIKGEFVAKGGAFQAEQLATSNTAHVDLSHMSLRIDDVALDGKATIQDSYLDTKATVDFYATSIVEIENSTIAAAQIEQRAGAALETNNVNLLGETHLAGQTTVNKVLNIIAEDKIDIASTASIKKGENSEIAMQAHTIEKNGEVVFRKQSSMEVFQVSRSTNFVLIAS